jgi:hypothetical protein
VLRACALARQTVPIMRPSDFIDEPRGRNNDNRALSERGTLRCEWCNKRTEVRPGFKWRYVDVYEWKEFVHDHTPYFCSRPTCTAHRRECGSTPVKPQRQSRGRDRQ